MNRWAPFEWVVAIRFLKEGRLQTAFIVGGVTIGVAVIVFMSAMLSSMQANFINRVLMSQPHIQLVVPDQVARPLRKGPRDFEDAIVQRPTQRVLSIDQWQKIRDEMQSFREVQIATPTVSGSALAVRGAASRSVTLTGIDAESYFRIVHIPSYIVSGEARLTSDDVIIGKELADDLGATVGDKLNMKAASGASRILTITGIVDLGNKGANQRSTYVTLRTAQSLLDLVGGATTIDITVDNVYDAEKIAQQIQSMAPVEADSWIKTNAQFFTAVNAQSLANTLIRLFVGLSVASGIAAVLIVSVIQRSKDIGILRAMGAGRGQILRAFLIQGALLGLVGSLVGSLMGGEAVAFFHAYARQADGGELFPLVFDQSLFIGAIALATLTGVVAALVPALRAANLDPVAAIHG